MKPKQAYRIAIKAMERRVKAINFDANLHELIGSEVPSAVNASKERKRLQTAIECLQAEIKGENGKQKQLKFNLA